MKRYLIIISLIGFLGCDDSVSSGMPGGFTSVIDGAQTPGELGFEINRLETNAVGGNIAIIGETLYQGCSGTLVGDRLVVTAAHCVVSNQQEWIYEGAEAIISSTTNWRFALGDDVSDPECLFHAQSFHLHPEAVYMEGGFDGFNHDMALVVLEESASETCPSAVPLQINWEQTTDGMIGDELLQGGFGSLDGTYDFSPIRYWSLIGLDSYVEDYLSMVDLDDGFPTYGDSGSGVLRRFDDGSLRVMGVASRHQVIGTMLFTRLDSYYDFVDTIATEELICGSVDEDGMCVDEVLVTCSNHGFTSVDCSLEDCSPNCACLCDTTYECNADCACDEDCPVDAGVDSGSEGGSNDDCSATCGLGAKKGKSTLLTLVAWIL